MSIRRKQTLIMMLTSSIALLLACIAFSIYEVIAFRAAMVQNLSTLADIVDDNVAAAVDFNDPKSAEDTLSALQAEPSIIGACTYRKDGQVFAKYDRAGDGITFAPPARYTSSNGFRGQVLTISRQIVFKGENIGSVYLESDMRALYPRLERYAAIVGMVFLASLLLAFMLSSQLQRLVSDPIRQLAKAVRTVAVEKDYSVRATKQSNDEFGQLVDGFNEMLAQIQTRDAALQMARESLEVRVEQRTEELEATHKQLLEASRLGGMAEVATNVLHNVGNVLNTVNVSATLVLDNVKKSKVASVGQVAALLKEHESDLGTFFSTDPRGKRLPAYLAQLSELLQAERTATVDELVSLRGNIDHIKEIVAMQQSYAKVSGVKEFVEIASLVEDSLRMNLESFGQHSVEVIRKFETVPRMNVEKHKVLQVLVNLMRNAKHACQEVDRVGRQITVRVSDGAGRLKISVMDNGVGISPENLTRIFSHGFTTRKDGHGFGLHSGALAAKEMGGSLTVQSGGLGQGATFTLELPCPPQEESNE